MKSTAPPQPLAVRLNCCDVCLAANPTRPDEPFPVRCSSCGSPIRQAPSWEGKGRAYDGATPDFRRHAQGYGANFRP